MTARRKRMPPSEVLLMAIDYVYWCATERHLSVEWNRQLRREIGRVQRASARRSRSRAIRKLAPKPKRAGRGRK